VSTEVFAIRLDPGFVAGYHEALKAVAESRRKAGLPVPDGLMQEHDVEL